jgi:hypothetical protein
VKAEAMKRVIATATRVASVGNGDGDGDKSDGDGDEGAGQATTRAMAAAMTVAGNCNGNEGVCVSASGYKGGYCKARDTNR